MAARLLKIVSTVVLLAALGMLVDWSLVFHTVLQARPEWLGIATLCVLLDRVVVTWRWRTILQATGYVVGFRRLLRVVAAGFGLREWLLTVGFLDIGIPAEVSVSVGLLSFFIPVLLSLPAIVLTLMASRSSPAGRRLREGES